MKKIIASKGGAAALQLVVMAVASAAATLGPLLFPALNAPLKVILQWIGLPLFGAVTAGILGRLVFVRADMQTDEAGDAAQTGAAGTLEEFRNAVPQTADDAKLLVAHPITLWRMGVLPKYQRFFFEKPSASFRRSDGLS